MENEESLMEPLVVRWTTQTVSLSSQNVFNKYILILYSYIHTVWFHTGILKLLKHIEVHISTFLTLNKAVIITTVIM